VDRKQLHRALGVLTLAGVFAFIVVERLPFCPMATVLGIPCPGCGLTRASLALLHGDVRGALALHPLVFVLAPLFVAALGSTAVSYVRGPSPARKANLWFASRHATWLASALLVVTLGVWGVRFFGYLGGPAPVTTLSAWSRARHDRTVLAKPR
jgi:Protein of unknown function (DUF2752)